MREDTKLVQLGRGTVETEGTVNIPVHRASTVLSPNADSYQHRFDGDALFDDITYGANGTQNARALAEAVASLEGATRTIVTSSGLSAITMTLSALLSDGDHILVTDATYGPTRRFCDDVLSRYGIETSYYEPTTGPEIADLVRPNTRVIFMEAPGSLTFEMQDIPMLVSVAKEKNLISVMDNTWATPIFFKPLAHGIDVSIQAGTKYIAGHSDLVIGLVSIAEQSLFKRIYSHTRAFGDVAGPDDCFLALRGLRSLSVRLRRHAENAQQVVSWLHQHLSIRRVLSPTLKDDPGHDLWCRDFKGAASLFGLILANDNETACKSFIDALQLFQIGSSWGGYESLVAFNQPKSMRTAKPWTECEFLIRLHIGLEDPQDLIDDLEQALHRTV